MNLENFINFSGDMGFRLLSWLKWQTVLASSDARLCCNEILNGDKQIGLIDTYSGREVYSYSNGNLDVLLQKVKIFNFSSKMAYSDFKTKKNRDFFSLIELNGPKMDLKIDFPLAKMDFKANKRIFHYKNSF